VEQNNENVNSNFGLNLFIYREVRTN